MCAGILYVVYTMHREAVKELTAIDSKSKRTALGPEVKDPVQFFFSNQQQYERLTTI